MKATQGVPESAHALWATLEPLVVTASRIQIPAFEAPASIDLVSGTGIRDARLQVNLAEGLAQTAGYRDHSTAVRNLGNVKITYALDPDSHWTSTPIIGRRF